MRLVEIKVERPRKVQLLQATCQAVGMRVRLPKDLSPEELEKAVDAAIWQINADASYYRSNTPYTGRRLNSYGRLVNHVYSLLKNVLAVTARVWLAKGIDSDAIFQVDLGLKGLGVARPTDLKA